jgi:WD40 repeat protein
MKKEQGEESPQVYSIKRGQSGWTLSRRGLLGAATMASQRIAAAGECGAAARAHRETINALAISSDGRTLASGGWDKIAKLWSIPDGALLRSMPSSDSICSSCPIESVAIRADGRMLASAIGNSIDLWALPEGTKVKTLSCSAVRVVRFTPDGSTLVSGDSNNRVQIWSMPDGVVTKTLNGHTDSVYALEVSADGRMLVSGSSDNSVRVWSLPDGTALKTLTGHTDDVYDLALRPDGTLLASADYSAKLKLWSLPDGALLKTVDTGSYLQALAVVPGGEVLVSGNDEGLIELRALASGLVQKSFAGHEGGVSALAISPDGEFMATAGADENIRFWTLPEGKPLGTCVMDPAASLPGASGVQYTKDGVTYTLPCGSPIPAGAVCICNCVTGSSCSCVSYSSGGGGGHYWYPN